MKKKTITFILVMCIFITSVPMVSIADSQDPEYCYISSFNCPEAYISYAEDNISGLVSFISEGKLATYSSVRVGSPFSFTDCGSNIYYFPVICDGKITYLYRVYSVDGTLHGVISEFLAAEIDALSHLTTQTNPIRMKMDGNRIVATIGNTDYTLFEYPEYIYYDSTQSKSASATSENYVIVNAKDNIGIEVSCTQPRSLGHSIPLSLIEQQGSDDYWCTAYCLAAILRKVKNDNSILSTTVAKLAMGENASILTPFPWASIVPVSNTYGIYPLAPRALASGSTLTTNISLGRPVIIAMEDEGNNLMHSVVLRGYAPSEGWSIWNPWYTSYENFPFNGVYVITGSTTTYNFTPAWHAYNFA